MAYYQGGSQGNIAIQIIPSSGKPKTAFHPILIIGFAIVMLIVVGALYFFVGSFINPVKNSLNGTVNITPATNTLKTAETTADYGLTFTVILLSVLDAIWQYYKPNKILGVVNIFLLMVLGFSWLTIKVPSLAIASGLQINTVFPVFYNFLSSNYFIGVVAIFMIIGIIFDFNGD